MSDDRDFSNEPHTITELQGQKAEDARKWTVRDALIALLRDIDSGKLDGKPRTVFIGYTREYDDGDLMTSYYAAGPSGLEMVGCAYRAIHVFQTANEKETI